MVIGQSHAGQHKVKKTLLTTYTDLFFIAALYWSFNSGRGLFGDLLILVLSSFISIKPVLDFLSASTITPKSFERRLNLLSRQTQVITNTQAKLKPDVQKAMEIVHAHQEHLASKNIGS